MTDDEESSNHTFSVVIPTWNEAPWLPRLLESLRKVAAFTQIIVSDNASVDGTAEIASKWECEIIEGGRPALARNRGAKRATGDVLVFVDADVELSEQVMARLIEGFADPATTLIHFRLLPSSSSRFIRLCYTILHLYTSMCLRMGISQGSAPLIAIRREVFQSVGGFDVGIKVAEDADLLRRVQRTHNGVKYITEPPIRVSSRRFDIENPLLYAIKCVTWGILRLLRLKVSLVDYKWVLHTGSELALKAPPTHSLPSGGERRPFVSIIIPTKQEAKYLRVGLESLKPAASADAYEIIVVDGGSTDGTIEIAESYPGLLQVTSEKARASIPKARNAGAEIGSGVLLFHTDADVVVPDIERLLERMLEVFDKDRSIVAATVRVLPNPLEATRRDRIIHWLANTHFRLSFKYGAYFARGECQFVLAEAFNAVGGYDERLVCGEDCDLFKRLSRKGRVVFLNELFVFHSVRRFRRWGYLRTFGVYVRECIWRAIFSRSYVREWEVVR